MSFQNTKLKIRNFLFWENLRCKGGIEILSTRVFCSDFFRKFAEFYLFSKRNLVSRQTFAEPKLRSTYLSQKVK